MPYLPSAFGSGFYYQGKCVTNIGSNRVIPCQFHLAHPHFVLDFLYMLTNCSKTCLGNIFQILASNVKRFLRYTAFHARRLVVILSPLILVPTSEAFISAMEADVVMKSFLPINLYGLESDYSYKYTFISIVEGLPDRWTYVRSY